jgi:hypothetical protein
MEAARGRFRPKRGERDDSTAVQPREHCGLAAPGDGGGVLHLPDQPDPVPGAQTAVPRRHLELEGFPVADISDYLADGSVAIWLDLRGPTTTTSPC